MTKEEKEEFIKSCDCEDCLKGNKCFCAYCWLINDELDPIKDIEKYEREILNNDYNRIN